MDDLTEVVPRYETPCPTPAVELHYQSAASAFASDQLVGLSGIAQALVGGPVNGCMMSAGRNNLQILRPVIHLAPVAMVDDLTLCQWSTEHRGSHLSMLVHVAARIGGWVIWALDEHVPIGRYCSAAFPNWIAVECELALT